MRNSMPKVEWGKKVVCTNCETKFYDLNRKPAVCPACGTEYIEVISDSSSNNAGDAVFYDFTNTSYFISVINETAGNDGAVHVEEVSQGNTV